MKFSAFTTSYAMSLELGERLKRARLNRDLTQEEVALFAGITRYTVKTLEKGGGSIQDLMALLLALEITDQLDNLLPAQELSPIEIFKLKGRIRKKASGKHKDVNKNSQIKIANKEDIDW